jgi:hypothetical protein
MLEQKINELIDVELHGRKGNSKRIAKEILDLSGDIYKSNFGEGFDVNSYRVGLTVLFSLLGAMGGGALGYGVDKAAKAWAARDEKYSPSEFPL